MKYDVQVRVFRKYFYKHKKIILRSKILYSENKLSNIKIVIKNFLQFSYHYFVNTLQKARVTILASLYTSPNILN